MSELHLKVIREASLGDLVPFRRGYGRSKTGPFFPPRTIDVLIRKGLLRRSRHYRPSRPTRAVRIAEGVAA